MYHQLMQRHLDLRDKDRGFGFLTEAELREIDKAPLPIFVHGILTDGPATPLEHLQLAGVYK